MSPPKQLHFVFVNPNSPAAFEETLKKILLEKLLAMFASPVAQFVPDKASISSS